jgi:hypothetical protein
MTLVYYDEAQKVEQARAAYFEANNFGADGGYNDAWVDFKLGPLPFPFPNSKGRVRAVRYHDLHHVLTGYDTDTIGEFEISAWEIAAGCKNYAAAWQLNLGGMVGGLVSAPGRTLRAFIRGRSSETLYGRPYEELLDRTVADLRRECGAFLPARSPKAGDLALFALALVAGLVVGLATLVVILPLMPLGRVFLAMRRADQRRSAARARS